MRPQNEEDLIKKEHLEFIKKEINGEEPLKAVAEGGVAVVAYDKINKICEALKDELWKLNQDNKYLLPILTTYIKK
jgi:hypothetical protein